LLRRNRYAEAAEEKSDDDDIEIVHDQFDEEEFVEDNGIPKFSELLKERNDPVVTAETLRVAIDVMFFKRFGAGEDTRKWKGRDSDQHQKCL
jgi:hypothetical protein